MVKYHTFLCIYFLYVKLSADIRIFLLLNIYQYWPQISGALLYIRDELSFTHTCRASTHLVCTDSAEGFLRRVRGQGKRVDFGQMRLYVKLNTRAHRYTHVHRPAMQNTWRGNTEDHKEMVRTSCRLQSGRGGCISNSWIRSFCCTYTAF